MTNIGVYEKYTNQVGNQYSLIIGFTYSVSVTKSLLVLPIDVRKLLNVLNCVEKGEFIASKSQRPARIDTTRLAILTYIIEVSAA